MKLTTYEQEMLDGLHGRLKQVAIENIINYALVLGTDELCQVTKATVFCGNHSYQSYYESDDFHNIFTKVNLGRDEVINFDSIAPECYAQTCVEPCDMDEYKNFNQTAEFFAKNKYFVEECGKAGVIIAGSCSPYLTGWLPVRGEHFVTTESSTTALGNSLWGACCNSDGIEAAFWSAICGRTPKWGYHTKEYRKGTHLVKIETKLNTLHDWEILGAAIGRKLPPNANPVLVGDFSGVDFNKIRCMLVSASCTSNCRMMHIVGITPEAPTMEAAFGGNPIQDTFVITDDDLRHSYDLCCNPGDGVKVGYISLGCPHYDIEQIKQIATYLKGKKIKEGMLFMVWTVYPIKCMADLNGYTEIIEKAGGHIYTNSCPVTVGPDLLDAHKVQLYDSYKQANGCHNDYTTVFYTDVKNCLDVAISGVFKEENRWKK